MRNIEFLFCNEIHLSSVYLLGIVKMEPRLK